jgi:RHS repeat-associated protein
VSPDTARINVLSTRYTYDAAGRKKTETEHGEGLELTTYLYDLDGNATGVITPRGDTITSQYDVMGRMVRRVVPEKRYAMSCPSQTNPCQNPYPHHPNGSSGSLVIPEEWTTFRFDPDGNMVYAENADAIVTRGYYPNGALKTDSLAIRSVEGMDFTTHQYGLAYAYNLAGQVTSMEHPTNLATNAQEQQDRYTYHPVTGALATLTDRRNHYFEFWHNTAGQMTSLRGPQYSDSLRYDLEGRLVKRVEWAALAGALHDDSIAYDARGKLLQVVATTQANQSIARQWYSGSGMLVGTDWAMNAGRMQEAYGMDALGNVLWRRSGDGGYDPDAVIYHNEYQPGIGRLLAIQQEHLTAGSTGSEKTTRTYDGSGNLMWGVLLVSSDGTYSPATVTRDKRSRSFYGADNRLRYFQERDVRFATDLESVQREGVWEEYRYDPLGRRVLVNTRTRDLCLNGTAFRCGSATTRMVWAGDQLLWEIRRSSESPNERVGPSDAYGIVSYTHTGGIDRPLVITKNDRSVLTHQNWRGQFARGTNDNGSASDCSGTQTSTCVNISWPGWRTTPWHANATDPDIRTWWGGLVDGMRDASGQQYMRNRYYDPATGQFTQPDPIGIAGGLNSYGFAAGDPVTYSDPYGLCPICIGVGVAWALFEAASSVYDGYDAAKTTVAFAQGKASGGDLAFSLGGLAVGAVAPGGGYGAAAREIVDGMVNPRTIRFTQNSISDSFKDGSGSVRGLADALASGTVDPSTLPPIRLVEHGGALFTLDNRRAAAAHLAGVNIPARMATPDEISREFSKKFTTLNAGTSIEIRNGGGTVP